MLSKLLKYNLKNQFKFFGLLYGLIIFNAVVARLLSLINDAPIFIVIVKNFFGGAMWAMIVNAAINSILRIWAEFRRSMYGDESYLMHTLPVKTSTLYWSKFIGALTIVIANTVVSILGILIAYANPEFFEYINAILARIANTANVATVTYGIILGLILLLEIFNIIISGFLAIILGHKKNTNKVAWSVGHGFVVYLISQLIIVAVFAVSGIFNSEMFGLFTGGGSAFDPQTTRALLVESCIAYPVIIIAISAISAKILNRGFDID